MTTLSLAPTYPVPGRDCQVSFALTESGTNYLKAWITDAPTGSEWKSKLDADAKHRVQFHFGDVAQPVEFSPDVGGVYQLVCQEFTKGTGYGGGYDGDPNGAPTETKVGAEATLTIQVGQRVTQQLGYGADTATLVWWVFGDYVRPTTLAAHGEASPVVIEPSSLRAAIAAKDPNVLTYTAASAGTTVSTNVGNITTIATNLVSKLLAHQVTGGTVHDSLDTLNRMPIGLGNSVGPKNLADVLNIVLLTMRNHYLNVDSLNGTGEGSMTFHLGSGGDPKSDRINYPIVESVGDLAQAYAALGDITRSYEAHRVATAVHGTADTTNSLMSMPNLVRVHRYFFAALASASPTAPATVNTGVVTAVSIAGFTES